MTDDECEMADTDAVWKDYIVLPLGASISLLSYAVIFYFYYVRKVPTLKRHPTSLGVRKCIFELIFVSQYLWIPFAPEAFLWQNEGSCTASKWAGLFAFITQFSLIGSELWFLVLTMDLHFACTNPFTSYKLFARRYEVLVFAGSLGTASILVAAGPKVYGLSSDATCWIQDDNGYGNDDDHEGEVKYNVSKILLFYLWMGAIYSYCLYVVLFVFRRLKQGLSETLHARISTVRRAQSYVLGYTFFWLFPLILSFMDFVGWGNHKTLRTLIAIILATRGLFSVVILLTPNWNEMKAFLDSRSRKVVDGLVQEVVEEDLSLRPHLNSVLRAEIIFFTAQGIRVAATEAAKPTINKKAEPVTAEQADVVTPMAEESTSFSKKPPKHATKRANSLSNASDVRTFACSQLSDTRGAGSLYSSFQEDLLRLQEQQRESVSVGALQDELDEALDIVGLFSNGGVAFQDRPSFYEDSVNADVENPVLSDESSKVSISSTDIGRLSENEFRLYIDNDSISATEQIKTTSATVSRDVAPKSTVSQNERIARTAESMTARERIKLNLLQAASQARGVLSASRNTPNDFTFKDYLPHLFAEVRQNCNISAEDYAASFQNTTKEKFSEGRSGAFLYFSSDQKYIVKTTSRTEIRVLLDMMKDYVSYLIANPNSLIVRFLGAHSLTMYNRVLYFVVMLNVFSKAELSERYDLKGSWVQRHGDSLQRRNKSKSAPLYKDNDLQHKIALKPIVANALHDQIFRDSAFLSGLGLMDYSLLVGVVQRRFEVMERPGKSAADVESLDIFHRDSDGGMHATVVEGPGTYYMGIIDILQHWNWEKKMERILKVFLKWEDGDGLSAIDPTRYADRFMKRCVMEVFEGLNRHSNDFNPKNKHNALTTCDAKSVSAGTTEFRIDKRFSASPFSAAIVSHNLPQGGTDIDNCDEL